MRGQSKIINLLKLLRVHIVLGGISAFTIGLLLATIDGGTIEPWKALLFYAIVFFGDLSTHYSNDYFDYNQDRNIQTSKFFRGKRILVKHPDLLPIARRIAIIFIFISISLSIFAVSLQLASIELLIITLGANMLGWFYSAKPRLVSKGLGEIAIAVAAGFAIPAVGYIAAKGSLDGLFWYFTAPFLMYGFMIALSLEVPDVRSDKESDKRTIGACFGEATVFKIISLTSIIATAVFYLYSWQLNIKEINFGDITIFSILPLAASFLWGFRRKEHSIANFYSAVIILSLFIFNLLLIVYFVLQNFGFLSSL